MRSKALLCKACWEQLGFKESLLVGLLLHRPCKHCGALVVPGEDCWVRLEAYEAAAGGGKARVAR